VNLPHFRVFSCLALAVLAVASAQTTSKQKDFDAIVARAGDAKNPQSVDANKQQLDEWAKKYNVKLQSKILAPQRVNGHGGVGPIAAPAMECERVVKVGRLRCVLHSASTTDPPKCYYDCS